MNTSILLISCEDDKKIEVADTIRKLSGIKESTPVIGTYDCVAKIEKMRPEDVEILVSSSIRPLDNIRNILTLHNTKKTVSQNV